MIESKETSLYSKARSSFCATASARSTVQPTSLPVSSLYSLGWYSGLIATVNEPLTPSGSSSTAAGSGSTTIFSSSCGVSGSEQPLTSTAAAMMTAATAPVLMCMWFPREDVSLDNEGFYGSGCAETAFVPSIGGTNRGTTVLLPILVLLLDAH